MLKFLIKLLSTKTLQTICNTCAHELFKRKHWQKVNSNHPELQISEDISIVVAKIEKWEWKVFDRAGNEFSHGVSPTPQLAVLDGHLWIQLLEQDKCNNAQAKNN